MHLINVQFYELKHKDKNVKADAPNAGLISYSVSGAIQVGLYVSQQDYATLLETFSIA